MSYLRDRSAYTCALDPAKALGTPASLLRTAPQCGGEIAGALPGSRITTPVSILAPLAGELAP